MTHVSYDFSMTILAIVLWNITEDGIFKCFTRHVKKCLRMWELRRHVANQWEKMKCEKCFGGEGGGSHS